MKVESISMNCVQDYCSSPPTVVEQETSVLYFEALSGIISPIKQNYTGNINAACVKLGKGFLALCIVWHLTFASIILSIYCWNLVESSLKSHCEGIEQIQWNHQWSPLSFKRTLMLLTTVPYIYHHNQQSLYPIYSIYVSDC